MTITKIELLASSGGETNDTIQYRQRFLVRSDTRDDGPAQVRAAMINAGYRGGIPYTAFNDFDTRVFLSGFKEAQVADSDFDDWFVDVDYSNLERFEDPLLQPVTEQVSWEPRTQRMLFDANGRYITNTAGDPPQPPLTKDDNLPSITYGANLLTFPWATAQLLRNAVNSAPWKGFLPGVVKVASMSSERRTDTVFGYGVYYAVSVTFEINPEGFNKSYDSAGFTEINANGKKVALRKDDGSYVTDPVPLDAAGRATLVPNAQATIPVARYPTFDFNTYFPYFN